MLLDMDLKATRMTMWLINPSHAVASVLMLTVRVFLSSPHRMPHALPQPGVTNSMIIVQKEFSYIDAHIDTSAWT